MRADEYQRMFQLENDYWWYRALREFLVREMKSRLRHDAVRRVVLDAGCGTGANLAALAQGVMPVGLDYSPQALALSRQRGLKHLIRAKVQELPLRDCSCDAVMSIDVLYHQWISDDCAVLRECNRVLRHGGHLFVHVAAFDWLRGSHDEVVMTRHRYTRGELVRKIEACGFRVVRATYRNSFLLPLMVARRFLSPGPREAHSDLKPLPSWANRMFLAVLRLENFALRHMNLPIGGSVFVIAERE